MGGRDPQKLIWTDTQGSVTYIAEIFNFADASGPRAYYATKNKWPQKLILCQFPHYFFTHLNTQMVSKITKNMCKSWENLHIGHRLILKFWPMSPLVAWVIQCPYDPGISAPFQDDLAWGMFFIWHDAYALTPGGLKLRVGNSQLQKAFNIDMLNVTERSTVNGGWGWNLYFNEDFNKTGIVSQYKYLWYA